MYNITRSRQYIENNDARLETPIQIKYFMFERFYLKRVIETEVIHEIDLELHTNKKSRELNQKKFKASKTFINNFKRENRISLKRFKKNNTQTRTNMKLCSLNCMYTIIGSLSACT